MTASVKNESAPDKFERFVNPAVGGLIRSVGLDKSYVWGKGCYLRDDTGQRYLDFLGSYGALPFGHSPDSILDVIASFAQTCEPIFVQPSSLVAAGELAEALLVIAPGTFRSVTFQNSGAEAVEASMKACIAKTGRKRILSTRRSFHGKTLAALSATGSSKYQDAFHAPWEGFDFVEYADAAAVRQAFAAAPDAYAAMILEPIQAEGGVHVPAAGYLRQVRSACDDFGVLLILDEVQTGLGRTGRMFASESEGIQADCLLLAKALGGGVIPIAACLLGENAYSEDFQLKHSSTFGGNSLACRVGLQVLKQLTDESSRLIQDVRENGVFMLRELHALASKYPHVIAEVRGEGYLIGVEFAVGRMSFSKYFGSLLGVIGEQENLVPIAASYLLNVEHVRVAPALNSANTMRIEPPLVATREQCEAFMQAFARTLAVIANGQTGELLAHLTGGGPSQQTSSIARVPFMEPCRNVPRFGFLVHPLELSNYAEFDESLADYPLSALETMEEQLSSLMDPFCVSTVRIKSPRTGQVVEGDFIMVPRSAAQLSGMPSAEVVACIERGMQIAVSRGAQIIGLGGYTSIVTAGGLRVAGKSVPVTTGNSYTILTAVEAACAAVEATGRSMHDLRVAVVGATGSIGSAIARLVAAKAKQLTLVGNPRSAKFNGPRFAAVVRSILAYAQQGTGADESSILAQFSALETSRATAECIMERNDPRNGVSTSNDPESILVNADLVFVATSSTERFIRAETLKRGAILCDVSRPANASLDISVRRPDVLVIDGGIVEAPGRPSLDARFGIPEDLMYACMAETVLLTLGGVFRDTSLGLDLDNADLELVQRLSNEHGFRLAGYRSFDKPLDARRWQHFLAQHVTHNRDECVPAHMQ